MLFPTRRVESEPNSSILFHSRFSFSKPCALRMSKRVADKQLTDRNWQDEEEDEEVGEFKKAAEDVIKTRV